jgi:protein-disulfide isomerase
VYIRKILAALLVAISPWLWADDLTPEQKHLIDQQVDQRLEQFLKSDEFQNAVNEGILDFIAEQNQQRAQEDATSKAERSKVILPITDEDYIYGDKNARFTLIEYSDYECPYCKKFHKTAEEFVGQNSDVNWVYRHFPLDFHNPLAQKEAEAAECAGDIAGNEGFWAYSEEIFKRTRSNGNGFPIKNLIPLAKELGINEKQFSECINSERFKNKVLDQYKQGQQAGVSGTPGNFLVDTKSGNIIPLSGAQPLSALNNALEQLREN